VFDPRGYRGHLNHGAPSVLANAVWVRELVGDDAAWDMVGPKKGKVCFINDMKEGLIEWFGRLSPSKQHQLLNDAAHVYGRAVMLVDGHPARLGVNPAIVEMYAMAPSWEGWGEVLENASISNRIPLDVMRLCQDVSAKKRAGLLTEALHEPLPEARTPRPRF